MAWEMASSLGSPLSPFSDANISLVCMFLGSMGFSSFELYFWINFSAEFEGNERWVLLGFWPSFFSVSLSQRGAVVSRMTVGFVTCIYVQLQAGFSLPKTQPLIVTVSLSPVCVRVVRSDE